MSYFTDSKQSRTQQDDEMIKRIGSCGGRDHPRAPARYVLKNRTKTGDALLQRSRGPNRDGQDRQHR